MGRAVEVTSQPTKDEGRRTKDDSSSVLAKRSSIVYRFFSTIRYRFFIFAGIFPFLLGQAIAFNIGRSLNWPYFWLGFLGILFTLIGVELFNEYFDAKEGGDRIFSQEPVSVPAYFFSLGILVFFLAFLIGLYFTFQIGWPILLFAFLGFLGAYFYVGPPFKWAYRGLGEIVIALCYGPLMVLGSYYLQTGRVDFSPFFTSLICGLSLFSLAIVNEIPDYYQDKLVGKRNLVVKLGRQRATKLLFLSFASIFVLLALGATGKKIPSIGLVSFLLLPWIAKSLRVILKDYDNPRAFVSVINASIVLYLVIAFSLGIGYVLKT